MQGRELLIGVSGGIPSSILNWSIPYRYVSLSEYSVYRAPMSCDIVWST